MRFRLTIVREYEVHPKNYGTDSVEKMLAIDQENADDDPHMALGEADCTIKVELVEE